ncbi:(Fe-S)-binding protein, partial [Calditrichota bacterium]
IPCLVDQVYPQIGMDMVKILKHFGYSLKYDQRQTCCGQPAFNAGHFEEARKVAINFINTFNNDEIIVCPSGSCTGMIRNFYSELFKNHPLEQKAIQISKNVFEISEFLVNENLTDQIIGNFSGCLGFHNSCHSYRELGITDQPFNIMNQIKGFEWAQPKGEPVCCGFGGLFSIKFYQIAEIMAKTRIEMFTKAGADTIVSNDPGCIMHMLQEAKARGIQINILHLTEFLAKAMRL